MNIIAKKSQNNTTTVSPPLVENSSNIVAEFSFLSLFVKYILRWQISIKRCFTVEDVTEREYAGKDSLSSIVAFV